jgi:phosphatidylserine/phosphatidylglycerophosphate/cardiolipin synthase-like enzyme
VLFASFLFSDEAIVRALCAASERLRGGVYVVTALNKHMQADLSEPDAEEEHSIDKRRQREQRHEGLLRQMARAGVWLRSSGDAHAKLCVVDDEVCAVTSANATREAYEINPELALIVRNPGVACDLGRLFARVWLHRSTFDSEPGADLNVKSNAPAKAPDWTPLSTTGDVRVIATLGADERSLLKATLGIIERAERELYIATYSLVAVEEHPVGIALRKAARRGVHIRLVLQPNNQREDQRRACAWLVRGAPDRVLVRGLERTHAKAIVADGARALVWTGNLDGRHGYESGFEVGIASERPMVVEALREYVKDLFERASHEPQLDPTHDA